MTQSVELLLGKRAEALVRQQWNLLADAGLASERRAPSTVRGSEHHRPHLTLFAAEAISLTAESALPALVADLQLELQLGGLMIFGPRRGRAVLVRQVVPTIALLELQTTVAEVCQADTKGQFAPGRWTPHVTLARRMPPDQLPQAIAVLDRTADRPVTAWVRSCRRWDGDHK